MKGEHNLIFECPVDFKADPIVDDLVERLWGESIGNTQTRDVTAEWDYNGWSWLLHINFWAPDDGRISQFWQKMSNAINEIGEDEE
tara:strand:- start:236 stop:493 length:258 start_codon:yes stop_codon:yes gene_type:complete